jgi:hypothetical protein
MWYSLNLMCKFDYLTIISQHFTTETFPIQLIERQQIHNKVYNRLECYQTNDNKIQFQSKDMYVTVFRIRSRLRIHRIHMFLGLQDPDPLVRGMDPDPAPDPSIIMQK